MKFPFMDTPTFRSWVNTLIDSRGIEVTQVLSDCSFSKITGQAVIPGVNGEGQVTHAVYYQIPGSPRILIAAFAMQDANGFCYITGAAPTAGRWSGNTDLSTGEIASMIRRGHSYACEQAVKVQVAKIRATAKEPNIQVQFQGYTLDLFMATDGSLGITVERSPAHEDNPCRDIWVSPSLEVRHDGAVPVSPQVKKNLDNIKETLAAMDELIKRCSLNAENPG